MDIKGLQRSIERIGTIKDRAAEVGSKDNLDRLRVEMAGGIVSGPYAFVFGQLQGAIASMGWDIDAIKAAIPELEHVERAYGAFADMDIDLDPAALTAIELMASEHRYRHLRTKITTALEAAIAEVQDDEREAERERVTKALTDAGFIHDESDEECSAYIRGLDRVSIEMEHRRGVTNYEWELKRNGEIVESGTNEFSRLIAAISLVKVEG